MLPFPVWVPPCLSWVPGSLFPPRPLLYLGWRELASRSPPPFLWAAHPALCCLPTDVNECWTSPGRLCQHTCENTVGSYRCSCASGFHLAADGKRCEGTTDPDLRPWPLTPYRCTHHAKPVSRSAPPLIPLPHTSPLLCLWKPCLASAGLAVSCHEPSLRAQGPNYLRLEG